MSTEKTYWTYSDPEDKTRCVYTVSNRDILALDYQCLRERGHGPDGLYCKQHAKIKKSKE